MKKNTVSLLLAASALVFMAGCAGGAKNSAAQKDETVNESQAQTDAVDAVDSEAAGTEEAGLKSQEAFSWLPADVVREKSETEPNEELRKLIAEYYEMIVLLGIFFLFFVNSTWWSWIVSLVICLVLFFMETLWDNISARLKWKTVLYGCWVITLVAGGVNILILMLDK